MRLRTPVRLKSPEWPPVSPAVAVVWWGRRDLFDNLDYFDYYYYCILFSHLYELLFWACFGFLLFALLV